MAQHKPIDSQTILKDTATSYFEIYEDNKGIQWISEIKIDYNFSHYFIKGGIKIPCLVKSEVKRNEPLYHTSHDNFFQNTLTIFPHYNSDSAKIYIKNTQVFRQKENYLMAATYGCCDNPTYYELSTFPDNKIFLQCNQRYHILSIPGTNLGLFIGFLINKDSLTRAQGLLGHLNYSINQKKMQSIAIHSQDNTLKILPMPTLEITSENNNDIINDTDADYNFMYAISQYGESSPRNWKGLGVKLHFFEENHKKNRKESSIEIEFKDGKFDESPIFLQFSKSNQKK